MGKRFRSSLSKLNPIIFGVAYIRIGVYDAPILRRPDPDDDSMKVLFLCTHNSCRSILSEALFNQMAPPGFVAYSAGSFPSGRVNPLTLAALQREGISIVGLRSKSSDEFAELLPDIVITVCDKAAGEACPLYFGQALRAHWGLADPSQEPVGGTVRTSAETEADFAQTISVIQTRLTQFFVLPFADLSKEQLQMALAKIGEHD